MEFRPILNTLRRSPTAAILVALQIALALAITVNALYIIVQRLETIGRDAGLDVANTFVVTFATVGREVNAEAIMREDIQVLRGLPGVIAATTINAVPLSGGGSSTMFFSEPGEKGERSPVNYFEVDEHGLETLGVKLVAGRNFDAGVVTKPDRNTSSFPPEVLLTRAAAETLFPGQEALGKTVYTPLSQPGRVVGIIEQMHGSWPGWDKVDHVALTPVIADEQYARYLVRARPGQRDEMMRLAEERLGQRDNGRIVIRVRSVEAYAAASYADDRAMAVYMMVVIGLLLSIAALGVFGLAAFNVGTRTRQIGTRRAVGARRRDVVSYFMVENWLVTTAGVLVGCVLALVLGYWLSVSFELPRLNLYYLLAGVLALWGVGFAAALVPSRRAARVSPAVATRTV